ncbi:TPA: ABC transporter permease subunit, partial [Streptococcus pneumoniae]|nr:ABC transporter permease subunit [Streptococcus pneumoniae]
QAVPVGQMEASRSLGISYGKTMRKIILPQATKLMLPNFVNQFVIALKDTTIVSAIGLVELFQTGKIIIARNYQSFKMYAILAIFYLVIITLLTRLAKRLEKRIR